MILFDTIKDSYLPSLKEFVNIKKIIDVDNIDVSFAQMYLNIMETQNKKDELYEFFRVKYYFPKVIWYNIILEFMSEIIDINEQNRNKNTALMYAVYYGKTEMVKILNE